MAFMEPRYYQGNHYRINARADSAVIPIDDFNSANPADHVGGKIEDIEEIRLESGWYFELMAPGYTDTTGLSGPYKTEREARGELVDMFGVCPDCGGEIDWLDDGCAVCRECSEVYDPRPTS